MTIHPLPPRLIGARVRRTEDPRLLTGRARYVDDVVLPGMLEGAVLRSPHAHARVGSVDASAALALPGVHAVLTGADLQKLCANPQPVLHHVIPGQRMTERYALATDKVRYVGEAVAAVAAVDRYVAEDALGLIDVEYDVLPAVTTLDEALAEDAPRLYEEWPDNVSGRMTFPKGDIAAAFAEADVVVRDTLYWGRQTGAPMETRGVVATWDTFTGQLDLWLSTQAPNLARDLLGEIFGLPTERIRVRTPEVGGGFGNKFDLYAEEVVASLLSRQTGRPVKIIEDRLESFVANAHAREQRIEVEAAAKADGTILGIRGTFTGVLGGQLATPGMGPAWASAASLSGPYDVAAVESTVVGVVTNRSPYGSYRGWGQPKGNFAHERIVDKLAVKLGLPPNEVRRRNLIKPDQFPYQSTAFVLDSGRYAECLERTEQAVEERGWNRLRAESPERCLGIGYSFHVELSATGNSRVMGLIGIRHSGFDEEIVRIDPTGGVTVRSGMSVMGQGIETALAQVAADTLGVPLDSVTVITGDTETVPFTGYGTGGSRGGAVGGATVMGACTRLRDKILRIAGEMLEASPADLEIADGRIFVTGNPDGPSVTVREVADACYRQVNRLPDGESPGLQEHEVFDPPSHAFSYGATAVLLEVDRETGKVTLLDYLLAHDCGTVINPMIVDGQLHGGAAQAIGGALYEEIVYGPDGQPLTTTFMDYLIPTAAEIPPFGTLHMTTESPIIPGGFKGMGEAGTISGPSAIAAGIDNALSELGIHITSLPVTPPRLHALITDAEENRA
ncbi:xanthine dehydrogenase family protein molybdopterin-binding subunit [Amycolatopsis jejuensis]|uniref:xanthine dehydrogenase family protein molybdopterin-binding subunit n=1 Tax=Amycolatopsis jejuensis TaxID=330084 RepID=UPI000A5052B1|nr:xanthine dehydrogenase family protein molybdopterin-binding subunit [Amycolatopsis jejuensis]